MLQCRLPKKLGTRSRQYCSPTAPLDILKQSLAENYQLVQDPDVVEAGDDDSAIDSERYRSSVMHTPFCYPLFHVY